MSSTEDETRLTAGGLDIQVPTLNPSQLVRTSDGAPVLAHLDPNNKLNRELFVGNIPPGTAELTLKEFLYDAMQKTNLLHHSGNPIVSIRINSRFAFVEFRSVEEATSGLNLNGVPFVGTLLKIGRPSKYVGPASQAVTWQELTGERPDPQVVDPSTKLYRELFVGNTAPEVTVPLLMDFLNAALVKVGLASEPVIVNARLNGKFAFVEFKSIDSCSNALNLDGIPFMGQSLKVSRPSKYDGPQTAHVSWSDMLTTYLATRSPAELLATQTEQPTSTDELKEATQYLVLSNMCSDEDMKSIESMRELKDDTIDECQQYGHVESVDILSDKTIVVAFASKEEATRAYQAISGRTFDGKTVGLSFRTEPVRHDSSSTPGGSSAVETLSAETDSSRLL